MQVVAPRGSTEESFTALYERFLPPIWDLAVRVLGDQEQARRAVNRIFGRAHADLLRREVEDTSSWLYGIAAAELPRKRGARESYSPSFVRLDPARSANPGLAGVDSAVPESVWAAATSLPVQDYLILDLQTRHGLRDAELARALRLDAKEVDQRSAKVRERLQKAAASQVSPVAVFAALAPVPPPEGLEAEVRASFHNGNGSGPREPRGTGLPWKAILVAVVVALLFSAAGAGAYLLTRGPGAKNPVDVRSTTHRLGESTSDPNMKVVWTPNPRVRGYSVSWSRQPAVPDTIVDLAGSSGSFETRLSPGPNWFNLRTQGRSGHWTKPVHVGPFLIVADRTAPQTTLTDGPKGFSQGSTTFRFASNEKDVTLECSLDGRSFATCTSPQVFRKLRNGRHTFRVRSTDLAGNVDRTPAKTRWLVDSKAPKTLVTDAPERISKESGPFVFKANESQARFECALDDLPFARCTSPHTYSDLKDGKHKFRVRAIDRAGNVDRSVAVRRWKLDTEAPDTKIVSGPARLSHVGTATFAISSEKGVTFECRLDKGAWGECVSLNGLKDGRHVMRARAKDKAENVDKSPARWEWRIDLLPQTRIHSGPSGPTASTAATFRFSSNDRQASFQCKLDARDWTACTSPRAYTGLSQGSHTFRVRARDAHGYVDASPATRTWKVDTVRPGTTIVAGPKGSTSSTRATFRFSSSEPGSSFECRLDAGAWKSCGSPKTFSGLAHGSHTFRVRAIDAAGNRDASPAIRKWTIV
jgi:DNA-directed RNA polymerase specialized sigma24 family protein